MTGEHVIPAQAVIQAMGLARTRTPSLRGGPSDTSFPRKRESRRRAGIGLDPRFPFRMRSAIRGGDTELTAP